MVGIRGCDGRYVPGDLEMLFDVVCRESQDVVKLEVLVVLVSDVSRVYVFCDDCAVYRCWG